MALDSLRQKLRALPGRTYAPAPAAAMQGPQLPSLKLEVNPTPAPRITPITTTSNSTPTTSSWGTVGKVTGALKLLNPLNATTVRPLGAKAGQERTLPYGGPVIGLAHEIGARTIEAIPSIALTTIANLRQVNTGDAAARVKVPFDASRLGVTDRQGQMFIENSAAKMDRRFAELEAKHPNRRGINAGLAALSPVFDVLDALAVGQMMTSVARQGLKVTNYAPELNKALQQYGIQGMKGEELTTEFVKRFNRKARKLIEAEDAAALDELGRSTNVILAHMTGKGIPTLNRFGRLIQTVSRAGLQDVKNGLRLKNPMYAELAPEATPRPLPGTVWDEAQPVPMGLSTRRVRRVGGSEDQPAGGPYYRSRENGKAFEPVDEKNVMPAPIRKDLDTFVVKSDEGYAVIEGQSGRQLGASAKTLAEAISSAKATIAELPDGKLQQMIDESQLSPRYEQEANTQQALSLPEATAKPAARRRATPRAADSLEDEARKYKSKEEFVQAQGKTVYRGTMGDGEVNKIPKQWETLYQANYGKDWAESVEQAEAYSRGMSQAVNLGNVQKASGSTPYVIEGRQLSDGSVVPVSVKNLATGEIKKLDLKITAPGTFSGPESYIDRLTNIFNRAHSTVATTKADDLIEEAKKYKTAEEFVLKAKMPSEIKIGKGNLEPEITRASGGQVDGYFPAFDTSNGKKVAYVDFSDYEGVVQIRMIEVDPKYRGKGLGTALVAAVQKEFPNSNLEWTFMSKDGEVLKTAYEKTRSQLTDIWKKANTPEETTPVSASAPTPTSAATKSKKASAPKPAADTEEQSLQIMAEQADEAAYYIQPSPREEARVEDNLTRIFAEMKNVQVGDLKTKFTEEALDQAKIQYEFMAESLVDHPGRALMRFVSKKEGQLLDPKDPATAKTPAQRARIEERNKKLYTTAERAFEGTKWTNVFDDPDTMREAIDDYILKRDALRAVQEEVSHIHRSMRLAQQAGKFVTKNKEKLAADLLKQTKALANLVASAERAGYRKGLQQGSKKYDTLVSNLRERRQKLAALQEVYDLTDAEFANLRGAKDPRFLNKQEFDAYLAGIEKGLQNFAQRRRERVIIDALVKDKDLKRVDNLRKALQMPKVENMTLEQLREFSDLLNKTARGDTFLSPRMIQTAKNTELGAIKTVAEGRAAVAKRLGIDPKEVTETADADVFLDAFLRDPAWADRDPLRKTIVIDWVTADIQRVNKLNELRRQIEPLAQAARKSRRKAGGVLGTFREKLLARFAKTDDLVAKYMETLPADLADLEKSMTPAEIEFGKFGRELMQKYYAYAMEDAAQRWTLTGVRNTRFKDMYLPHMGPKFFERWKDNGLVSAAKSMFMTVQESNVDFNAFGDRGEVLGYEKFFKNSQKRENLETNEYSKNVAAVLLRYADAFERKIQLDSQIPKIKLLEQLLGRKYRTPKSINNPEGAEKVSSDLTRVLNEWINNKKGQKVETLRIKQGSEIEKYLQSTNILISLLDLGGNIITQTASGAGGEVFNMLAYARGGTGFTGWAKGHARALKPQGRRIARNNPGVIDEAPWVTLADSFNEAGQTLMSSMFYLFADLSYRSRRQLFLGSLTKEEYKTGIISPKRLAEIKLQIGKVHALPEFRSVQGGTALVQLLNKYTEWAVPNFQTSAGIVVRLVKDAKRAKAKGGKQGLKDFMKTRAYRDAAITAFMGIGTYAIAQILLDPDKNDKTVMGKWRAKLAREMGSIIQSSTGVGVFGSARALDLLQEMQNVIKLWITLERYEKSGAGYSAGDLKAGNATQRLLLPTFVEQFFPEEKPVPVNTGSGKRGRRARRQPQTRQTTRRKKRTRTRN